jgi:hypothetical protein
LTSRQKIQIWYGMGCHNTVTGRVLSVDHDHIDVESYSHESDGQIHVRRILVPLHLILHIDITSAEISVKKTKDQFFCRKRRQGQLAAMSVLTLPDAPRGYAVQSALSTQLSNILTAFSRMTAGPGGIYFSCDGSVWFIDGNWHSQRVRPYPRQ